MKRTAIALALTAAICCPAQNLIQNPDFRKADQKGHAAGWVYQDKQFSRVESDKPGRFVIKSAEIVRPEDKMLVMAGITQQNIKIPRPGKYVLSFTGKVLKQGALNASWSFFDKQKKKVPIQGAFWSKAHYGSESKTVTHILDIPEGVAMIRLSLSINVDKRRKENAGSVIIEEVSLSPQKE